MFHELFSEALEKLDWSTNFVSKEFGLNRGTLYKYCKGQLLPIPSVFEKMLSVMNLLASEAEILSDQYFKEYFGEDKFERIKFIDKTLCEYDLSLNNTSNSIIVNSFDCIPDEKPIYLSSVTDIIKALSSIFEFSSPGRIITNYPYSCREIDDAFFELFRVHNDFEVIHTLDFDNNMHNMQNILFSMRWLAYMVNPLCCNKATATGTSPYPCFFTVDAYCLLFNPGLYAGFLIKSIEMSKQIKNVFAVLIESSSPLALFPSDMLEYKNEVSGAITESSHKTLAGMPCFSALADEELVLSVIKREVPNIEFLAGMAVEHYKEVFPISSVSHMISDVGLIKAANEGKIAQIPSFFVNCVPIEQRVRYFNRLISLVHNGQIKIYYNKSFHFSDLISFDFFENMTQISGTFLNGDPNFSYRGNWILAVKDKVINDDFNDFTAYLRCSKQFYSEMGAVGLLKSLIQKCKNLK